MRQAHLRAAARSVVALFVFSGCGVDRTPTALDAVSLEIAVAKPVPSTAVQFGTTSDESGSGIAVGRLGVAVAGGTNGTLAGVSNAGGSDVFVRLHTPAGGVVWVTQFGTSADDRAYGVAQDRSALYVAGTTSGSLGPNNLGASDGFVRKLDAAGREVWTTRLASAGADSAFGVAVDGKGVYVVGELRGALEGAAKADADGFVAKLDAATGQILWTTTIAGTGGGADQARDVAVDRGGVFVAATIFGGYLGTGPGLEDAYAVRLDAATGEINWLTTIATAAKDVGWDVAAQRDVVYLVGTRSDDGFATALDAQTGAVRWVSSVATSGIDVATTVVVDRTSVLVGGATSGAFPGSSNQGQDDAYLARLEAATGAFVAAEQFGTGVADAAFGSAFDGKSVSLVGTTGGTLFVPTFGGQDAWWASMSGP